MMESNSMIYFALLYNQKLIHQQK